MDSGKIFVIVFGILIIAAGLIAKKFQSYEKEEK